MSADADTPGAEADRGAGAGHRDREDGRGVPDSAEVGGPGAVPMTDHAAAPTPSEEPPGMPTTRDWTIGPDFPRHADRVVGGRPRLSEGQWSHRYAACVECGTTS